MVCAYHAIFSMYGFCLPNDPRSSWSDFVRSWQLFQFRSVTKTLSRQSLAGTRHNAGHRRTAKSSLRYPAVRFSGVQARTCARGFAATVERSGYIVYACSILPEHVRLVVARHRRRVEQIVAQLKGVVTKRLVRESLHPFGTIDVGDDAILSPRGRSRWKVFLNTDDGIRRASGSVEDNPVQEGTRRQRWGFVTTFDA